MGGHARFTRVTSIEEGVPAAPRHWEADVSIKGVIASVGGRLIQGAADRITQQLFACIKSKLEAATSAPAAPPA